MAELGALEAMADGLRGPRPRPPRPGPYSRNPTTPPKNFHGEVRGYQEPSRAKQTGRYKTRQDSPPGPDRQDRKALQGQTDRTGKPSRARQTGQESPPGPDRQDRTALQGKTDRTRRQESPPGPDRHDRTSHRNQKPSWASSEAEASSGHDQESGALTGSLSDRLHFSNKGAGG